ncbi:MAG: hypothetical protein JWR18_701 [Segetibacter sp.]|jgi:hypothetical protein|nr:hypothetical protein [Segetibacter sp.]
MKNLQTVLCAVLLSITVSCGEHKPNIKELVDNFVDLECRAITLREKRFELANQMRFTQDTLLQTSNKADTSRLKSKLEAFNKEKEVTLQQSLSLADSIRIRLNDMMKNELSNETDKTTFNETLNKTLVEKGCLDK